MKHIAFLTFLLLTASLFPGSTDAQSTNQKDDPDKPNVAIVLFDGVQIIDFTGPYEVFGQYSRNDVYTVAAKLDPITTTMGMTVVPAYTFANAPAPDVLVVPGGTIGDQKKDTDFLEWIQAQSSTADYTLSVCNGAFLLAEAGLLDGLQATTFYNLLGDLAEQFPAITVVDDQRFVDNGNVITSAGLSSGIDAALHVQAKLHGSAWANAIALNMEYDWQPETDYSRPQFADMNLPSSIYKVVWPDGTLEEYEGNRTHWVQTWQVESDLSAEALTKQLATGLAEEDQWQRDTTSSSHPDDDWTFTGRDEQLWYGSLDVQPVPGARSLYKIIIHVSSSQMSDGDNL
ncbi:MAG TPA: DJ-1/PfpI family protein [Rhodothermales bacterium]|nr:DJ-1/PfpI family protein [Rhodothermales bacterium]